MYSISSINAKYVDLFVPKKVIFQSYLQMMIKAIDLFDDDVLLLWGLFLNFFFFLQQSESHFHLQDAMSKMH